MGQFTVGDVVLGLFPFSDIVITGQSKKRPCLVVGFEERGDIIVVQITSQPFESNRVVKIESHDFAQGKLPVVSFIRPDKLFTTDPILFERKIGTLKSGVMSQVLSTIRQLFAGPKT